MDTSLLAHFACCGNRDALRRLKEAYPRRAFRRFHCDLRGTVLKWRLKGSKAAWRPVS